MISCEGFKSRIITKLTAANEQTILKLLLSPLHSLRYGRSIVTKPTLVSIRKQVISLQSATKTDETVVPRHLKVPEHINGGSLLCQRGSLIGCKAFAYPSMVCQLLANELSRTSLVGRMCPNCTDHVYILSCMRPW